MLALLMEGVLGARFRFYAGDASPSQIFQRERLISDSVRQFVYHGTRGYAADIPFILVFPDPFASIGKATIVLGVRAWCVGGV